MFVHARHGLIWKICFFSKKMRKVSVPRLYCRRSCKSVGRLAVHGIEMGPEFLRFSERAN